MFIVEIEGRKGDVIDLLVYVHVLWRLFNPSPIVVVELPIVIRLIVIRLIDLIELL